MKKYVYFVFVFLLCLPVFAGDDNYLAICNMFSGEKNIYLTMEGWYVIIRGETTPLLTWFWSASENKLIDFISLYHLSNNNYYIYEESLTDNSLYLGYRIDSDHYLGRLKTDNNQLSSIKFAGKVIDIVKYRNYYIAYSEAEILIFDTDLNIIYKQIGIRMIKGIYICGDKIWVLSNRSDIYVLNDELTIEKTFSLRSATAHAISKIEFITNNRAIISAYDDLLLLECDDQSASEIIYTVPDSTRSYYMDSYINDFYVKDGKLYLLYYYNARSYIAEWNISNLSSEPIRNKQLPMALTGFKDNSYEVLYEKIYYNENYPDSLLLMTSFEVKKLNLDTFEVIDLISWESFFNTIGKWGFLYR